MDFPQLMADCAANVSVQTMAAIVKQESNFNPYAIGVNGDYILERQPGSKEEALEVISWLKQEGQTNLDLGIAQISQKNRELFNLSVKDSLNPCLNLNVGGKILTDNYKRSLNTGLSEQAALRAAISEYNTGSRTAGFSNGYVQKVVNNTNATLTVVPDIGLDHTATKTPTATQPLKIEYPQLVNSRTSNSGLKPSVYTATGNSSSLFVYSK